MAKCNMALRCEKANDWPAKNVTKACIVDHTVNLQSFT